MNPTHYATGGPTMPVGPVSGEIVDNLLISSVAANTQAHETTAVHQPDPTSDWSEKVEFPFHDVDFIWFTVAQNVFLCRRWMVLFRAAINCTCTTLVLYLPKTGNIFSEKSLRLAPLWYHHSFAISRVISEEEENIHFWQLFLCKVNKYHPGPEQDKIVDSQRNSCHFLRLTARKQFFCHTKFQVWIHYFLVF